ncbi:MAG: CopG family transcriptional regulator [Candidatus Hydrogenedentes bacterium]|nr:CopG family transcriptional regulator [Candidatus Hydrogenedentota bacterium]
MSVTSEPVETFLAPELLEELRSRATQAQQSLSEYITEALRLSLQEEREDLEDLAIYDIRKNQPTITLDELIENL